MLNLIGIGLKPSHITIEALKCLKESDVIYLENYTSAYSEGSIKELEEIIEKKIFPLNRIQVEERFNQILFAAKNNNISFLVFGNVFSATTHTQIVLDATKMGIKTKYIPGISIFNFLGRTGLQEYKFGKTISIPRWEENFQPTSFYQELNENFQRGLHTLCLLDIKKESNYFMSIIEALKLLEIIDEKTENKENQLISKIKLVGLYGIAGKNEKIVFGSFQELKELKLNEFPQALIICGKLNEIESEALNGFKI